MRAIKSEVKKVITKGGELKFAADPNRAGGHCADSTQPSGRRLLPPTTSVPNVLSVLTQHDI